jgi:hypothetical protein
MTDDFIKATQARVIDGSVRFTGFVTGGEPRVFEISGEALMQHFGAVQATDSELLQAFERGHTRIMSAAAKALETPAVEGAVVLGSGDFDR